MPRTRSLLDVEHLTAEEITSLLKLARKMHTGRPKPLLRGKRLALLFYEASTRTRVSFEFAAKLHGGAAPKKFTYRGVQPLFEGTEFSINANETEAGMELWTANAEGQPTMKGAAVW